MLFDAFIQEEAGIRQEMLLEEASRIRTGLAARKTVSLNRRKRCCREVKTAAPSGRRAGFLRMIGGISNVFGRLNLFGRSGRKKRRSEAEAMSA